MIIIAVVSILNEVVKGSEENEKYKNIISKSNEALQKSNQSLSKLDSNIKASNANLIKSDTSLEKLALLQRYSNSIINTLSHELNIQKEINARSKDLLLRNEQVLSSQEKMISSQRELLTMSLMDKIIVPKFRVVLAFANPLARLPKRIRVSDVPKSNELTLNIGEIENLYPGFEKLLKSFPSPETFLEFEVSIDKVVNRKVPINKYFTNPHFDFIKYTEDKSYCIALEFKEKNTYNLAEFYALLKNDRTFVSLRKAYEWFSRYEEIVVSEKKFENEDVTLYLDIPINEGTGVWVRMNFDLVDYSISKQKKTLSGGIVNNKELYISSRIWRISKAKSPELIFKKL